VPVVTADPLHRGVLDRLARDATRAAGPADVLYGYLEAVASLRVFGDAGYAYGSVERFVVRHGEPFAPPRARPRFVRPGLPRCCFANAVALVLRYPVLDLTYVEGFALLGDGVPTLHAWAVAPSGDVIDPTWAWGDDPRLDPTAGALYGVRLPTALVRAAWPKQDGASILDNHVDGWPLLRAPFDPDRAVALYDAMPPRRPD
jgi:hypothetical protein